MLTDFGLTGADLIALVVMIFLWSGFTLVADRSKLSERSIGVTMSHYRKRWMAEMAKREVKIGDIQIARNQMNGAAFFASAAIFAAGGVFALLGATDQAMTLIHALPISIKATPVTWTVKLLCLVVVLAHAFFKFAWAFRLYNYCSVLIGSTPDDPPASQTEAARAAGINNLAAQHFNRGLRSLFFALAFLGWFIHPMLLIFTSTLVVLVLYRREFRSRSLKILQDSGG